MSGADVLTIGDRPSPDGHAEDILLSLTERLHRTSTRFLGYPANLDFDHTACGPLLPVLINNAGDPCGGDPAGLHAKPFENATIAWFTRLAEGDPADTYGYVTSGGSEGLLFGLSLGRHRLPNAPVYASDQAHYGVRKAAGLLRMELVVVPSDADGAMDPDALRMACEERGAHDARAGRSPSGAVIVATVGTTMTGAFDDVAALRRAARAAGDTHVHSDAALGGLLAAFAPVELPWNLRHGADSVSVSGHKFIGCPVPCGIVVTPRHLLPPLAADEYLGSSDHTLDCSRSGLAAVLLWKRLHELGTEGLRSQARRCRDTAAHAVGALARVGANPRHVPHSITVTFDRPPTEVCNRWHLAAQNHRAHLLTMPHVTPETIDIMCADLAHHRGPPPSHPLSAPTEM
ncbi:histidine decarboxylase [Streptomyces sp. NPDC050732]|uniref:histidine decarboxylase n=1 Tax=Streptomyces sp. NPDC050732 TaxID=3154632 RepID=UPI00343F0001